MGQVLDFDICDVEQSPFLENPFSLTLDLSVSLDESAQPEQWMAATQEREQDILASREFLEDGRLLVGLQEPDIDAAMGR